MAFFEAVGSLVCQVAEISVDAKGLIVHRLTGVIDCGTAIHPNAVLAQMQGCLVMGLSATLTEEITIEQGRCAQRL
ncbi:molybdopterin cofactor-binding domain-containing protein [Bradyrhizobium sp. 6(2017)]|uniref:molybdopterin cofactor-binding domain-containing protein n=1 Tax=Bradyrhizobium sp. 6(2017) TaxID=1197460 RepID=UPI0013E1117B|nr:molybdopterin cofactor-binding domain-containing protein [Bradyrhizobium sp. 6(2017)]QIG97668.1 molybdopterin-dependent oxidoreductase [Bradyrhizobium sp. 6(2017)]